MAFNAITTGEQSVTATGAVTGTLDTSGMAAKDFWAIKLRATSFASGQTATVVVEDTANSTAFSDAKVVAVAHITGPASGEAPKDFVWKKSDVPNTRFGATNTKLRFNVTQISGGTLKLNGWLEP